MDNPRRRPVIKSFAEIKRWPTRLGLSLDPAEVWRTLVAIDPDPPGPLAVPPYILALPDDGMDGDLFLDEAKTLYREHSGRIPVEVAFRPIPRSISAREITFVLPDLGMDERAFAEKAVSVRITLEAECQENGEDWLWA